MYVGQSWVDTILVDTRTGKYFFAIDYLRSHSRQELFHELAYGHFEHEEKWDGKIRNSHENKNQEEQTI